MANMAVSTLASALLAQENPWTILSSSLQPSGFLVQSEDQQMVQGGGHQTDLTSLSRPAFDIMRTLQVGMRSAMLSTKGLKASLEDFRVPRRTTRCFTGKGAPCKQVNLRTLFETGLFCTEFARIYVSSVVFAWRRRPSQETDDPPLSAFYLTMDPSVHLVSSPSPRDALPVGATCASAAASHGTR
jgi:hypothetical protein